MPTPVIAIFDVGKTNKKLLLFDEGYHVCAESSEQLPETLDEDGFPCEDVQVLTDWIREKARQVLSDPRWEVRAFNFSGYGASLVHMDSNGKVIAPLYNYLKPYPSALLDQLYKAHGGREELSVQTASHMHDSLSSGLQLYRLKYEQPDVFGRIAYSLHLPQYLSYVLSDWPVSDITSTGCHTGLWDFEAVAYHRWVAAEGLDTKLGILVPSNTCSAVSFSGRDMLVGVGLHDSSAALIPYQRTMRAPFLQLSTGTWCVSMNPFNRAPLTLAELERDCLCYLSYEGRPVKASRLMLGKVHEEASRALALHFGKPLDYFEDVRYNEALLTRMTDNSGRVPGWEHRAPDFETAYHQLISELVDKQVQAARLVLEGTHVSQILVDGGFCKNPIFMRLLAQAFPELQVRAASIAQASAIGAALCIHEEWNTGPVPSNLMREMA
jgi:sugar (pentulose or hexulose) kinase